MSNYSAQYTFQAVDQITPFIKKMKGQIDAIKQQMRGMSQRVRLNVDSKMAQREVKKLSQQFYRFASKPKILSVDARTAHSQIQQLSAHYRNSMKSAQMQIMPASKHAPNSVPQTAKAAAGGAAASKFGMGSMVAGFGGYAAVNSALDLGKATTELKKFTGATGAELEALKAQAFALESQTGYAAAEIMGMMSESSKAGVATRNLANDVLFAAKAGIAFDMSASEAAQAITHLRGAFFATDDYATQQKGLQEMANMISYVADNSASSEKYLVDFMQRSSGLVHLMGVTKESLAAAGGAFEAIGIAPEVAARAMNSMQNRMAEFSNDTKGIQALGLDPKQFKADMQTDLIGTTLQVIEKAQSMGKLDSILALKDIYGEFGDELVRLGAARKIYADNLTLAGDKEKQAASFAEAYKIQMEGLNASWNRAKEGLKSVLGITIAPYLKAAADAVAGLMEWAKEHPTLIKFAAGIIAITTATKAYSMAAPYAVAYMSKFVNPSVLRQLATMPLSFSSIGAAARGMLTPLGATAVGVGAFAGIVYGAYTKSSHFQRQLSGLGGELLNMGKSFGIVNSGVKSFGDLSTDVLAAFGDILGDVVYLFKEWIIAYQDIATAAIAFAKPTDEKGNFIDTSNMSMKESAVARWESMQRANKASEDERFKRNNEYGKSKEQGAIDHGNVQAARRQAQEMQNGANAVNNTKAAAQVATNIPTTAKPEDIAAAKEAAAQQKQAADTSKTAADTSKQAADTQKSSADKISQAAQQMLNAAQQIMNAASKPVTVNVNGGLVAEGGNLGSQGR